MVISFDRTVQFWQKLETMFITHRSLELSFSSENCPKGLGLGKSWQNISSFRIYKSWNQGISFPLHKKIFKGSQLYPYFWKNACLPSSEMEAEKITKHKITLDPIFITNFCYFMSFCAILLIFLSFWTKTVWSKSS